MNNRCLSRIQAIVICEGVDGGEHAKLQFQL